MSSPVCRRCRRAFPAGRLGSCPACLLEAEIPAPRLGEGLELVDEIGRGGKRASKLVLSVVPTAEDTPTDLPPCPSLRGQPCRTYVAAVNGG